MAFPQWQLQTSLSAIIFDCDGTLSTIEGIDELAKNNGVSETVKSLTAEAMGKSGINQELYQKRLDLVYPTQKQVLELGHHYFTHQVPDAKEIIQVFKRLNKAIYLVSAGLYPAVSLFAKLLHVPCENVFAVNIQFDAAGQYQDYDRTSPLIHNNGKQVIVTRLKALHPALMYIGDGLNDLVTYDIVTRFVGYGGVYYRKNIAMQCQYYIRTLSLTPLLPLSLTQEEYEKLTPPELHLYAKGVAAIQEGLVNV